MNTLTNDHANIFNTLVFLKAKHEDKFITNVAADQVPPDASKIEHIENGIESEEKFVHAFANFVIL